MLVRTFSLATLLLTSLVAQGPDGATDKAPERIHVIGASVSGGFEDGPLFRAKTQGESISLQRILKKWCDGEVKVTTHPPQAMWVLFQNPKKIGKQEIELCKRRKPDLVMAVDFLFWFAYGYVRGEERQARLALLDVGIGYLKQLDVPIIIGDLPDMSGAARRMISPRQIPSPELLKELNARLRKFAAENDNVVMVPLSKTVKQLKVDGVALPLAGGEVKTAPCALLQEDKLHATKLGMALLAHRLQDALRAQFPEQHALGRQQWTFEQFVEAAGAEVELEDLLAKEAGK